MNLTASSRELLLCWALIVIVLLSGPLSAQDAEEPPAEIMTALRALGLAETKARTLSLAVEKADEEGSIAPLVPYLADPDLPPSFAVGLMMIEVDAEAGARAIRRQIVEGKGHKPALFMSLCAVYDQENVDFLIAQLTSEGTKDDKDAIDFSLRVITAQTHSDGEAWTSWWKANREAFVFAEPDDMEAQLTRMKTAIAAFKAGKLRDVIAGAIKGREQNKATEALSEVAGMIESLGEATQRGQDLRLSEQASAGDTLFSEGKLEAAEQMYSQALQGDTNDERSRFLRACLLFEAGRYPEAAEQFGQIHEQNRDATASRFLRVLSERRQRKPEEPLLDATLEEFHKFEPAVEAGMLGWSDEPVIEVLMAQRLAGNGVTAIAPARLDELLARHEEDAEIAAGVALLRHRDTRAIHLQAAWERHPKSPLLTAALLYVKLKARPQNQPEEVDALIKELAKSDEKNALPRYLSVVRRVPTAPKGSDGKKVKSPLSAVLMAELVEANALPRFDSGRNAAIASQYRVLKELGHPFRGGVYEGKVSFNGEIAGLADPLSDTAELAFAEGRMEAGKAACEMIGLLGRRLTDARGSFIDRVFGEAVTSISVSVFEKHSAPPGQAKPKAAVRPETETRKARAHIDVFALLSLPIPSLENAIMERVVDDEVGFLQEQSARKRKAASVGTP